MPSPRLMIAGAVVAICAALALQTWRVGQLQDQNATLEATVEGYREAARIYERYAQSRNAMLQASEETARDLQEMEGRDEPLSDHLRGAAGRVWSTP